MTAPLAPAAAPPAARSLRTRRNRTGRRPQVRLLFLLPAAVFLGLFGIFPLFQLVRMSLSKVGAATLNGAWQFTGLDNFTAGFASGESTPALYRTLLLTTGLRETSVPFLYDQYWALIAVAFVNSFVVIPFNALVFRAALMNIPPETFEAAALDGASRWQEIRHIMLSSVRPTTLVLLVLTIVYGFRSFDFIYVMTYGGPGTATNTLPFLGYLQAFVRYDFGLGAATSVVAVLGVLVLAAVYARSIRREESES